MKNKFNQISSFLAFIIWGSWAYFINMDSDNALISALIQGLYSALMSLSIICFVDYFYTLLPKKSIYFILPSILTIMITTILIIIIHFVINTYDILNTITPPIIIAFLFSLYTTLKIKKGTTQCLITNQEDL
ncbi:hypothetical protein [Arcobacter sp.]|uniref:hypothetical protein n=1 Tax=Arcobacter sp. TaxID=1872629 RepID=UPI003C71128B